MSVEIKHPKIREFMTPLAYWVAPDSPLLEAQSIMQAHGVRHLPVIEDGTLIGMLSQSDLHLMEALIAADPEVVVVREAMSPDVYTATPDAPLGQVAAEMARRRIGSAVVMDGSVPAGIFTASDALRALGRILGEG